MKVFTYNIAVAKRNRPSMRKPLARILYNEGQGKDLAFLLSEKGRLYVVRGSGVVDFPADQLEQAAFEKYAPLRDMKLLMVTKIHSCKRKRAGRSNHIFLISNSIRLLIFCIIKRPSCVSKSCAWHACIKT